MSPKVSPSFDAGLVQVPERANGSRGSSFIRLRSSRFTTSGSECGPKGVTLFAKADKTPIQDGGAGASTGWGLVWGSRAVDRLGGRAVVGSSSCASPKAARASRARDAEAPRL